MSGIQDEACSEAMAEIERLTGENARLKKLNLMTDDELVLDLKSEINHLKTLLSHAADALEAPDWDWHKSWALAKELRKAAQ
jgi:hypothetical protein